MAAEAGQTQSPGQHQSTQNAVLQIMLLLKQNIICQPQLTMRSKFTQRCSFVFQHKLAFLYGSKRETSIRFPINLSSFIFKERNLSQHTGDLISFTFERELSK